VNCLLTNLVIFEGSWLINTARGAIVVKEDVAEALKSGHLRGYGGDVWFPQPAPKDHPLRYAHNPFGMSFPPLFFYHTLPFLLPFRPSPPVTVPII
jgi:hypothetical protein